MNFMPYESDADWVITGVPFDMATSGRAGGRHGPAAIRQVSTNLAWEHNRFPWNFDMRERLNVVDCGDLVYAFGDAREMSEKLQAHAEKMCIRDRENREPATKRMAPIIRLFLRPSLKESQPLPTAPTAAPNIMELTTHS